MEDEKIITTFEEANMDENEKELRKFIGSKVEEEQKARIKNYKTNGIYRGNEIKKLITQLENVDIEKTISRKVEIIYPINNTPNINKLLKIINEFKEKTTKCKNILMREEKKEAKKIIKQCYIYIAHKVDAYLEILYQNNVVSHFSDPTAIKKSLLSALLVNDINMESKWLGETLRFVILILGFSTYYIEIDDKESLEILANNLEYLLMTYKDYVKVLNNAILEQEKYLNKTVFFTYKDLHQRSINKITEYTNKTFDKITILAEEELELIKLLASYC